MLQMELPGGQLLGWCRLEGESGHAAGRRLLAELYRQKLGRDHPEIAIAPWGKPYFPGNEVHFSITHTKMHAFCILSPVPVGIDAEEKDRPARLALADKVLSSQERAAFDLAQDKAQAFLKLWVLKEAAAKCSGEGLRGYPNHTNFSLEDPRITEIDGCYVAIMTEGE